VESTGAISHRKFELLEFASSDSDILPILFFEVYFVNTNGNSSTATLLMLDVHAVGNSDNIQTV
jgi:hypothetical protein